MSEPRDEMPDPLRLLPDPAHCRAERFAGFAALAVCRTESPEDCIYVVIGGPEKICLHPHCTEIIARSQQPRGL